MLAETKPNMDWKESVQSIIQFGKFLALREAEMPKAEYVTMLRSDFGLDDSAGNKLINIAKHPILSNPEYADSLPKSWAILYEMKFLADNVLVNGIKNGSFVGATKYNIWELRGVKINERRFRANSGPRLSKVQAPTDLPLVDYCRTGVDSEDESAPRHVDDAADRIGISIASYRMVRAIIKVSNRVDLNAADREAVDKAIEMINRTRNVRTYYQQIKPIIDKIWGTSRAIVLTDKNAQKRVDAFKNAILVLGDTCEQAARITQPHMTNEDINPLINHLTEARKVIGQITENLRRAKNG